MKKRFLSIFCVLALCLTLLPVSALAADTPSYVALGDSITTGYAPSADNETAQTVEDPFANQVAEALGYDLSNLAEDGETTATLLAKLQSGSIDVSNADLITITIGGNDLMNALYGYLLAEYNEANPDAQLADTDELKDKLLNGDMEMLTFAAGKISGFFTSDEVNTALSKFTVNLSGIVTAIKTANPDVTVLVATQYNPYSYLAKTYGSYNPMVSTISAAFDAGVKALNEVITTVAATMGFSVVDVYTVFEEAVEQNENPCNPSIVSLSLDFHPNQTGHDLIAAAIIETLQPQSTYTVTVEDADHGSVQPNTVQAVAGSAVTLTVTPDDGYELDTLTATDANGNALNVTKVSDGQYTFTMPDSDVTVEAVFTQSTPESLPFADVTEGTWYADAVRYVYESGLMAGYGNGLFGPDDALSRAQLCQILYNAVGRPAVSGGNGFTDVDADAWYADAVNWAAANGIVLGYGNGCFGPEDNITREQLAVILYRVAQALGYDVSAGEDTDIQSYEDFDQISDWAVPAMQWAVGAGVILGTGDGSTLSPLGETTRAEAATMLMRL